MGCDVGLQVLTHEAVGVGDRFRIVFLSIDKERDPCKTSMANAIHFYVEIGEAKHTRKSQRGISMFYV
jgi:hypothetical protein